MATQDTIKFMREQKHLSQEQMAERLNMSPSGYAKIERGETKLRLDKLEEIAQIFDIDVVELMALGERNFIIQDNQSINIIGSPQELAFQITQLKKDLKHRDQIIAMLKSENETLKDVLALLKKAN